MNKITSNTTEVLTVFPQLLRIRKPDAQDIFLVRKDSLIFAFETFADGGIGYELLYGRIYPTRTAANRAWPRSVVNLITKPISKGVYVVYTSKAYNDKYPHTHLFRADKTAINTLLGYAEEYYREYLEWQKS